MNGWNELIQAAMMQPDTVPDGWLTMEQLCEQHKLSRAHMQRAIYAAGDKVEKRKFRLRTAVKVYPVTHYRIRKSPAQSKRG